MTTNQPATELTKATTAALCDRGFIGFRTIAQTENTTVYHTTGSAARDLPSRTRQLVGRARRTA